VEVRIKSCAGIGLLISTNFDLKPVPNYNLKPKICHLKAFFAELYYVDKNGYFN